MGRPCERRLRTLVAFVVVTYLLSSLLYLLLEREPQSLFLYLHNATWWRASEPAYNMSLLEGKQDMNQLIDTSGFDFQINNKRCDDVESVFLVVFVHSAPANFKKREVIRSTWGHEENLSGDERMRVVFLLGSVNNSRLQNQIEEENRRHKDIVQGNFADSYRNLTYKHVMGLKWVTYFCRQARFVFKADDDIFVDIFQLTSFLKSTFEDSPDGVANLMMCYLIRSPHVKRSQRSKWRVSFKEYPGRKYPTYCAGWGVLMSPDVVFKLYVLSSKTPYFWVDDVHVTGTLAGRVGVSHVDFTEKLSMETVDMHKWLNDQDLNKPYLFGQPNSDTDIIRSLWEKTMLYYQQKPQLPTTATTVSDR